MSRIGHKVTPSVSTQDMRDNGCQEEEFNLTQTRDTQEEKVSTEELLPSDWNCLHQIGTASIRLPQSMHVCGGIVLMEEDLVQHACLWGYFLGCVDGGGSSPPMVTPGPVGLGCVQKLAEQRQGASQ